VSEKPEFLIRNKGPGGASFYVYNVRAPTSNWWVEVSVPASVIEAPAEHAQWILTGGGLIILTIFGGVAAVYSRRLARSIKSASAGAASLVEGKVPEVEVSSVSEVERLRASLVTAADLLQSKDRAKSEFLANMSHELRTPLGIVLGMTELLASDLSSAEEKRKHLEIVNRNAQLLLRLVNDILDLSKIEANKLEVENIDFLFPDMISSLMSELKPQAEARGIELRLSTKGTIPQVINSDPIRLRQAVQNIVGNALKFTKQGYIEVELKASETKIFITIADTGIGIAPNQVAEVFSVFTQGDSSYSRKYGGAGLGLALSRRIAQLLGGDVELLESGLGKGSKFLISIAYTPGNSSAVTREKARQEVSQQPVRLSGVRILLAEDSLDNIALIQTYLRQSGAIVDVAENGIDAVKMAQSHPYDIILMDIQMPGKDGYEATAQLRREGYMMPIVALTAHALSEHKVKAVESGYTDYITKPVRADRLFAIIRRNLRMKPVPLDNASI
jgi:signal transduction histidine kinase/CheY-like chemotaxis protein